MKLRSVLFTMYLMLAVASCQPASWPTSDELEQLLVSKHSVMLEEPLPTRVMRFQVDQPFGWGLLCGNCHVGPHFSSHTNLDWAHRQECLQQTLCFDCHWEKLHQRDARGSKQLCVNCHLAQGVTHACESCHVEQWQAQYSPHDADVLVQHGALALLAQKLAEAAPPPEGASESGKEQEEQAIPVDELGEEIALGMAGGVSEGDCLTCHGSERWCLACHGVPMPHPSSVLTDHPKMVQGRPDICANCHGEQSCQQCHAERGVRLD